MPEQITYEELQSIMFAHMILGIDGQVEVSIEPPYSKITYKDYFVLTRIDDILNHRFDE